MKRRRTSEDESKKAQKIAPAQVQEVEEVQVQEVAEEVFPELVARIEALSPALNLFWVYSPPLAA